MSLNKAQIEHARNLLQKAVDDAISERKSVERAVPEPSAATIMLLAIAEQDGQKAFRHIKPDKYDQNRAVVWVPDLLADFPALKSRLEKDAAAAKGRADKTESLKQALLGAARELVDTAVLRGKSGTALAGAISVFAARIAQNPEQAARMCVGAAFDDDAPPPVRKDPAGDPCPPAEKQNRTPKRGAANRKAVKP